MVDPRTYVVTGAAIGAWLTFGVNAAIDYPPWLVATSLSVGAVGWFVHDVIVEWKRRNAFVRDTNPLTKTPNP